MLRKNNKGFTPHLSQEGGAKSMGFLRKKGAGFTLIELMVVISIIGLLSAIALANYRAGERQFALQRSVHQLAQDIRRAQSMAMAAKEINGRIGHGIKTETNKESYTFISCDSSNCVDIEEIDLEKKIYFEETLPLSPLMIIFFPPDPEIIFKPDSNLVSIKLNYQDGPGKIIKVNKAGLIEVE